MAWAEWVFWPLDFSSGVNLGLGLSQSGLRLSGLKEFGWAVSFK